MDSTVLCEGVTCMCVSILYVRVDHVISIRAYVPQQTHPELRQPSHSHDKLSGCIHTTHAPADLTTPITVT